MHARNASSGLVVETSLRQDGEEDRERKTKFYHGAEDVIFELPSSASPERLSDLVAGKQITASADGKRVVVIQSNGPAGETLTHSAMRLVPMVFEAIGTRVLDVCDDSVLVWGKPMGDFLKGVYRLTESACLLVDRLDIVLEIGRSGTALIIKGRCDQDEPAPFRAITPCGTLDINYDTVVAPLDQGGVQLLQKIGERYYRYLVGYNGIDDLVPVPIAVLPGELPIASVRTYQLQVLCLSGEKASRLVSYGELDHLFDVEKIDGQLECVWQSPQARSIAYLARRTQDGRITRTLFLNGHVICQGAFSLRVEDLRWSPGEEHVGAYLLPLEQGGVPAIVASKQSMLLEDGDLVDFLIDDLGCIAARLVLDRGLFTPYVYNARHTPVVFAWNLTWSGNVVRYNSVNDRTILTTYDQSHLHTISAEL